MQQLRCSEDTPDGETPVQNMQSSEKALRKNIKAAEGGLRAQIKSLREEDSSSNLGRKNVPRPEDFAKRGTSTTFLVEELKTDDGLTLSGNLLLEARSDWVRDLLSTGNSLLLRRIADRLGFVGLWALMVSLFYVLSPPEWQVESWVRVPAWPHELIGGFLSILLVFRTDQAYQRFWEGRAIWADVAGNIRSMAMVAVTVLDGRERDVVMAHLCVFPVMLKQHLRGMRSGYEILGVVEALGVRESWRARGIQQVLGSNNMPLTLLTSLSSQLRGANSMGAMTREDLALFKENISQLAKVVSDSEKLRCTPIPLSYSRHTSRFFTLFALSLPFSLIEDMTPILVAPVVVFISWILFATEEIGLIIEEPFGTGLQPVVQPAPRAATEEDLRQIFDYFDIDGSGLIDKTELFLALDKLGIDVKPGEIEKLVAKVDANGNNLIEFDEFSMLVDSLYRLMEEKHSVAAAPVARDPYSADGVPANVFKGETTPKYTLPGLAFTVLVRTIFEVLSVIWGKQDLDLATVQLEVLPLDRYVLGMQRDVLQQAAFIASQTEGQGLQRQRYMEIASKLRELDRDRYKAPWRFLKQPEGAGGDA